MIAQRRVSLVSRRGTVMRLVGDRTTLCVPHCRRLQHRQVGLASSHQVARKSGAELASSPGQVHRAKSGPSASPVRQVESCSEYSSVSLSWQKTARGKTYPKVGLGAPKLRRRRGGIAKKSGPESQEDLGTLMFARFPSQSPPMGPQGN